MKELKYFYGEIEVTLSVPDKDYDWILLLFARNKEPFKALRDFGYTDVQTKSQNQT